MVFKDFSRFSRPADEVENGLICWERMGLRFEPPPAGEGSSDLKASKIPNWKGSRPRVGLAL